MQSKLIEEKAYPSVLNLPLQNLLESLSKKYTLALVTGSSTQEARFVLQQLNVLDLFTADYLVTRDVTPLPKTSGAPFNILKQKLNGKAVVIGDSEADAVGATKAGLPSVLVDKKFKQDKALAQALKTCEKVLIY